MSDVLGVPSANTWFLQSGVCSGQWYCWLWSGYILARSNNGTVYQCRSEIQIQTSCMQCIVWVVDHLYLCVPQNSNLIAYAGHFELDQNRRPIAGYSNFCPRYLKSDTFDEKVLEMVMAINLVFLVHVSCCYCLSFVRLPFMSFSMYWPLMNTFSKNLGIAADQVCNSICKLYWCVCR